MKKFALTLAGFFFALFLLVGCNNTPKPAEATEDATVIENVDVVVDTVNVPADTLVVETEEVVK